MKTFKNKVAVITGAGSGIGRALAINLAGQGAKLALADINDTGLKETVNLVKAKGAEVIEKVVNVADKDAIIALKDTVLKVYGHVDMVFNNAGIALGRRTLIDVKYEEMERIIGINLWGVVYGSKEFLPHLLKRPEAAIINISSVFGLAGIAEQIPYCTTKFAVRGFTESLRMELMDTPVEVYCVHPGGIKTNIARASIEETDSEETKKEVEKFESMLRTSPEKAASTILNAVKNKNKKILIGEDAYIFDYATRLLPRKYTGLFSYVLKKDLDKK